MEIEDLLTKQKGSYEVVSETLRDDPSKKIKVVRHQVSDHIQLYPLPSEIEETEFYNTDSQTQNIMGKTDLAVWRKKSVDDTERRVKWLQSLVPGGKVLDIGCGYSFFVDLLAQQKYDALGIDISSCRIKLAQAHLDGKFIRGWIDRPEFIEPYRGQFQAVALFHVLEHVRNPIKFLKQCFEFVAPGGYLLIEVPNCDDELLEQQSDYRNFYWQVAHLSYFTADTLGYALRKASFTAFTIRGVQRYGLRNLLNWLDYGKPQLSAPSFQETKPILQRIESLYKRDREERLTSDTLIVEVRK
ncbi:bifunctional 2-polyprenyl-6-hydroxyphenol methylase/3-demethylubiquinol 3-O-methyltransferase UbiG [Picosynechococcus sp. PCC 7117]|uniref:class I SAM-dependent methyltransferase n=1 Tax=Picosynechococcus sp. PCC 7117 TaxID=195498 RepID=UPI00081053B2|nr:class I SAM-dependent methyltransferase [Picosynechococcus sp. PCC 7117]ANV86371.1 hypothetical protein AWQ22_02140 [Picosynechococcus sp. PCC 7117]